MKKMFLMLGALSLVISLVNTNIQAEDTDDTTIVCYYELNEDGELEEICQEVEIMPLDLCTPECWGV